MAFTIWLLLDSVVMVANVPGFRVWPEVERAELGSVRLTETVGIVNGADAKQGDVIANQNNIRLFGRKYDFIVRRRELACIWRNVGFGSQGFIKRSETFLSYGILDSKFVEHVGNETF